MSGVVAGAVQIFPEPKHLELRSEPPSRTIFRDLKLVPEPSGRYKTRSQNRNASLEPESGPFKTIRAPHSRFWPCGAIFCGLESSWPLGALPAVQRPPGQSVLSGAVRTVSQDRRTHKDDRGIAQWITNSAAPSIRAFRVRPVPWICDTRVIT